MENYFRRKAATIHSGEERKRKNNTQGNIVCRLAEYLDSTQVCTYSLPQTNQPNRTIAQNISSKPSSSPLFISILGLAVVLAGLMLRSSYISHQPLTGMQLRYLHHEHVLMSGI